MLLILNDYLCYAMWMHNQMWTLFFLLQSSVITFWRQIRWHNFFTGVLNFWASPSEAEHGSPEMASFLPC